MLIWSELEVYSRLEVLANVQLVSSPSSDAIEQLCLITCLRLVFHNNGVFMSTSAFIIFFNVLCQHLKTHPYMTGFFKAHR